MKLKCISSRLNYVGFNEKGKPHRVRVGDTFSIKAKSIPEKWEGLVVAVDGDDRKAVTNPAKGAVKQAAT